MDTFEQLVDAVQSDLTIDDGSSLTNPTTVKLALNRAYRKAAGLHPWPDTEDAKLTSTQAGLEYYDYPTNWRPYSIWKLRVDGDDLKDPIAFKDYLYEQENNFPAGNTSIWSNQRRRYFITVSGAAPATTGSNNIEVWGYKIVDALSLDADTTIFSYVMPEVNDAIVMEAVEILRKKGEDLKSAGTTFLSPQAENIINDAWNKLKAERAKYEKTQPMFEVQDLFPSGNKGTKNNIGNF